MIKIIMSVVAAAAITLTSVVGVVANQNVGNLDDQYVKIGTCYVPLAEALEDGQCIENEVENCTYTKTNTTGTDCNDNNFESNEDGHEYIPN